MTSTTTQGTTTWTIDAVRNLGTTMDVETAGAALGIGRTKAYQLARAGEFPVPVIRAGPPLPRADVRAPRRSGARAE